MQLQIHQNKEFAQILYTKRQDEKLKSITLKPGYEYKIEITPDGQRSTPDFNDLPSKSRNCKLDNELENDSIFKRYTKANCMYECEISKAYEDCSCIPWDFFHSKKNEGAKECDVFGRTCFQNAMNRVTKDEDACNHCIGECNWMNFNLRILSEKSLALENPYINYT